MRIDNDFVVGLCTGLLAGSIILFITTKLYNLKSPEEVRECKDNIEWCAVEHPEWAELLRSDG